MAKSANFPPPAAANWLLFSIVLVIAPHGQHLPIWLSASSFAMLAWRWGAVRGMLPLPGKWILVLLAIAATAGILLQYRTLFGRDAGVSMVTLLLTLKLLETRSYRDAMFSVFLGFFLLITNFFYTQSIPLAAYLIFVVLVLTCTMITLHHPASAENLRLPIKASLLLIGQAIPVMLVFFLLFPRLNGPLWGLPNDAFSAASGLSENMAPGSISQLVQSDAVSFRSEFTGHLPAPSSLYWRALVLEYFDGRAWSVMRTGYDQEPAIEKQGEVIDYTVTIEPHNKHWIFALEAPDPLALPPNTGLTRDLRLISRSPLQRRTRYTLKSFPGYKVDRGATAKELQMSLQLPKLVNPQSRDLARRLRSESQNDAELVAKVLRIFNDPSFNYTLTPQLLGTNSVDEFIFQTKSGFCEHYAGAFTFLMRAAGIPARVVTGYLGGEFNDVGNYMIVRQSDAHAWSEVWLKDQGWVRVDPTVAVASDRIDGGVASALSAGEPLPFLVRTNLQWLKQLRLRWDALNNQWNQWVVGYDQEQQIGFFASLGMGILSWRELTWGLIMGIGIMLGIFTVLTLWPGKKPSSDKVQALYLKFCAKLEKAGISKPPSEGPDNFAERVRKERPEFSSTTQAVINRYIQLRYSAQASPESFKEFESLIKGFKV